MSGTDIISRMMKAVSADNEAELLRKIGLSSGASAQWKRRGTVSDKSIMTVARLSGVNPQWIKNGEGPMRPQKIDRAGEEESVTLRNIVAEPSATWAGNNALILDQEWIALFTDIQQLTIDQVAIIRQTVAQFRAASPPGNCQAVKTQGGGT